MSSTNPVHFKPEVDPDPNLEITGSESDLQETPDPNPIKFTHAIFLKIKPQSKIQYNCDVSIL